MVSDKEIEARAVTAFVRALSEPGAAVGDQKPAIANVNINYVVRAALSAAARVRAEDDAGEPVGWTCPHDGGWDREMGPIGCLLATHNLDCVCAARFAHPAPQPSGPVEVTSETVHPSHDVRDEDISGISSDPVCQRCRISAYGPDEDRLLKPCPADEHGTNPDDEAVDRFAHPAPQPSGTVKALDEDDYEEIISAAAINMRKATSGIRGQVITAQDSLDWWVMKETERRILSALNKEGQGDD